MSRQRKLDKGILVLVLIIIVVAGTAVYLAFQLRSDAVADDIKNNRTINVIYLVHSGKKLLFTELLLYHPGTGNGAMFDIPGNWGTMIGSPSRVDRVDVLYKPGDPSVFVKKLEQLMAVSIPYYIELDLDGVEHLVDLLDGIELFIANPVENYNPNNPVMIPSGSLVLDGAKTKTYITYQSPDETAIEERSRHQKLIQALVKRIGERPDYVKNEAVFEFIRKYIQTNMRKRALLTYLESLSDLKVDHVIPKPVLGEERSVAKPSTDSSGTQGTQVLLFPYFDGNLVRESVRQSLQAIANANLVNQNDLVVSLAILNGTATSGLASRTRQLFMNYGYDDVTYGNADSSSHDKTVIIANVGQTDNAKKVAQLIKCNQVETSDNPPVAAGDSLSQPADVTIILGKDFDGRYCKQ